ncbi:MAG: orotate phosphoribosyltransferase [Gemmatimonadota bacterium]
MNYRSFDDMNARIVEWALTLPADIDLIVGVPRSGLLAATLLALHRNLPMADLDGFLAGRVYDGGRRFRGKYGVDAVERYLDEPRSVLIVDDSIRSGASLREVRERVGAAALPHRIRYGVVFADLGTLDEVDHYCEVVAAPRAFEWNLLHADWLMSYSCVDIDGVLCPDPTPQQNDDGSAYLDFIANAPALHTPNVQVGWLVTCRLEKYRPATEAWLEKNGIRYSELLMMDYPDAESRRAAGAYGAFKSDVYCTTGALFFVESNPSQASEIAQRSGKPVYCMGTRSLVRPSLIAQSRRRGVDWLARGWVGAARRQVLRLIKRAAGKSAVEASTQAGTKDMN